MNSTLVTRDALRRWGFVRLTDAWLYSSSSKRREYFETWHNSQWNCRVHPGFPEADPLSLTEQEFLQRIADELVSELPVSQLGGSYVDLAAETGALRTTSR